LEEFPFLRTLDASAADAFDANPGVLDSAVLDDLDILQIGSKGTPADAGNLPPYAAKVLGLTAPGDLIAKGRSLAANSALHSHDSLLPRIERSLFEALAPKRSVYLSAGARQARPG
jgi:hypothetical protein